MENKRDLSGQSIELQDYNGEYHLWYLQLEGTKLFFGAACNVGLLKEGYIEMLETDSETLQELVADLELHINGQSNYMSHVKLLNA